ncbi:MAG: ADP-ribosylglycohydrolase family protein [Caldilineaceae bacterium]
MSVLEKFRGCLLGLAIGDALGAPVEFEQLAEIRARFGRAGITDLVPWHSLPAGSYTDDTQMALATVRGMLAAHERGRTKGIVHGPSMVYRAYLDWLATQDDPTQRRAPGNTCLSALRSGKMGTLDAPLNYSKGCGGVMRTAPVGLAFRGTEAFRQGVEYAVITHGHPSGYLSAGFMAELIGHLVDGASLDDGLDQSSETLRIYAGYEDTLEKITQARVLAGNRTDLETAIREIGEGWVGDEALGVAIFCALRFPDDYRAAVIAGANHDGDVDSTASMAGAILGTMLGAEAIPAEWIAKIENRQEIESLAARMHEIWG